MTRILIVEDDFSLGQTLMNLLGRHYETSYAPTLLTAKQKIDTYTFDVAIIDRCLPDGDGLDLVMHLAEQNFSTRTLLLTRKSTATDKVEGLQQGADDYLGKPFSFDELMLRVESLLTKSKNRPLTIYHCGPMTLFLETRRLQVCGEERLLRKKEAQVLAYFLSRINQVITREDLRHAIWGPEGRPDIDIRTIDVNCRRLRLRLGAYRHFLQSIHGTGYRLSI